MSFLENKKCALRIISVAMTGMIAGCGAGQSPRASNTTLSAPGSTSAGQVRDLGDGKVSAKPVIGSIFSCQRAFPTDGPGAFRAGEWIDGDHYDPSQKPTVDGAVDWPGSAVTVTVRGDQRVVTANNLPKHETGEFPVAQDDDAYDYDRNPNAIREQDILLRLPLQPEQANEPQCVPMGMIGFALSGAAIFNALDVQGRDAPAHEIQDLCNGHPEPGGQYHYHDWSACITAAAPEDGLVGYALDGFGIYGPQENGRNVTNADLDPCHGHEGEVLVDGVKKRVYHYHFTEEYPYTLGCFMAEPVQVAASAPDGRNS
ncbi:MAG: YHYH protein [Actinomycetota bacterium]